MKNKKSIPLHPILQQEGFMPLFDVIAPKKLEKHIGRKVQYLNWDKSLGSLAKTEIYKIGGIQKDYRGDFCFRVYATSFNDKFGRCMDIMNTEFVD